MVTIDGKEYDVETLSDEVKYMLKQVQDIDSKLAKARFEIDQLQVGRNAFVQAIAKSVKDETGAEE